MEVAASSGNVCDLQMGLISESGACKVGIKHTLAEGNGLIACIFAIFFI